MFWALLLLCFAATIAPCVAIDSRLAEFLGQVPAAELVPGADHYGPPQGSPPVAKVFAGERLAGYAFVNADWVNSTGYSGQPIQILVGLATDGKIAGARLMAHHEPIVLIGIPPERIAAFIQGYVGRDVLNISHDGSLGAAGGGHREWRDGDRDRDRREHGAFGDPGRPRRGHWRAGGGRSDGGARDRPVA